MNDGREKNERPSYSSVNKNLGQLLNLLLFNLKNPLELYFTPSTNSFMLPSTAGTSATFEGQRKIENFLQTRFVI